MRLKEASLLGSCGEPNYTKQVDQCQMCSYLKHYISFEFSNDVRVSTCFQLCLFQVRSLLRHSSIAIIFFPSIVVALVIRFKSFCENLVANRLAFTKPQVQATNECDFQLKFTSSKLSYMCRQSLKFLSSSIFHSCLLSLAIPCQLFP